MVSNQNPYRFEEDLTRELGYPEEIVTRPAQLKSNLDFFCPACQCLPREPVFLACRHLMCKDCEIKWSRHHARTCPVCRQPYHQAKLFPIRSTWIEKEDHDSFRVKCDFLGQRCGFEGNPVEVNEHQRSCKYVPWICAQKNCGKRFAERDWRIHEQWHKWENGQSV